MRLKEALALGWTEEQYYESIKNHDIATKRLKVPKGYVLHHIDPSWRKNDPERYIQWNLEDLELMTKSEHSRLHGTGENNPMYGKHHTEESKDKMRLPFSEEHKQKLKEAWVERRKRPISEETRAKMREASTGRKHTEETKKKISLSKIGHEVSEETRKKLSEDHKLKAAAMTEEERKAKFGYNKGKTPANKGIPHTEETKRKMSEAQKGKKFSEETKRKMKEAWKRRKMGQ